LTSIRSIGKFFLFVVTGIAAIIVGSFMIRGTMHLWDKSEKSNDEKQGQNNNEQK